VNPGDNAATLSQLGRGEALLATGLDYKEQPEKAKEIELAKTLNQVYKERYGGWDNFVKTFQEDPVGVLGDVSTALGVGGGAVSAAGKGAAVLGAAETGGKIANVGQKIAAAGEAINPVTLPYLVWISNGASHRTYSLPAEQAEEGFLIKTEDFTGTPDFPAQIQILVTKS